MAGGSSGRARLLLGPSSSLALIGFKRTVEGPIRTLTHFLFGNDNVDDDDDSAMPEPQNRREPPCFKTPRLLALERSEKRLLCLFFSKGLEYA
jgi:hypothetical protein